MLIKIAEELKSHAPFTLFGAFSGILIMLACYRMPSDISLSIFYVLHPMHVFLSALVTAAIYEIHKCGNRRSACNIWVLLLIGYIGSVGIATLSDSAIPFLGELMLGLPNPGIHLGFIEKWWLVNPLAFLGIAYAYFRPTTKFPHSAHVLISTWASLFHIIMALGGSVSLFKAAAVFVFLFLAVWLPCCFSDIVFPMLFVRGK